MQTVKDLIDDILRREGGYVHHPSDRGGPTNFGITQRTLSDWLDRPATIEEIKALDEETAREIYERNYYRAPRIDTLPEEIVAQVFDCSVNLGPKQAIRLVQKVLNLAHFGPVDVDGVIGPQTRVAAEEAQSQMGPLFGNAIMYERIAFYETLVSRDPSQAAFLKGWTNRAREFAVDLDQARQVERVA